MIGRWSNTSSCNCFSSAIEVTKLDLFGGLVPFKAFSLNYCIQNIACCVGKTIQDVYLDVLLSVVFFSMLISTK